MEKWYRSQYGTQKRTDSALYQPKISIPVLNPLRTV